MNKRHSAPLFLIAFAIFVCGCAKITDISGGEKDARPPRIVKAEPDSLSLNFVARQIVLKFDEYINVKNPSQEIFYSPPMKNAPDVVGVGKKITIKIKDTLIANTTYCINFGSAVEDITENNIAKGLHYVFSTGSYIDSLFVQGAIIGAFDQKPQKNIKIMLYDASGDSLPYLKKPLYYTFSDDNGNFRLNYLKNSSYKIFALDEENGNFLYDRPGEKIAFLPERINPFDSAIVQLKLFREKSAKANITRIKSLAPGKLLAEFEGDGRNLALIPQTNPSAFEDSLMKFTINFDSLQWWYRPLDADSVVFHIKSNDKIADTITLKIPKNHQASAIQQQTGRSKTKEPKFAPILNTTQEKLFDVYSKIKINFNKPAINMDTSKVFLFMKEEDKEIRIIAEWIPTSNSKLSYEMNYPLQEEKNYRILLLKGAFQSVDAENSDSIAIEFKTKSKNDYGNLTIQMKNLPENSAYIVDLINNKDELVKSEFLMDNTDQKIRFDNLEPGDYKLRLIKDENGNKQWDSGIYLQNMQPESIYFMNETITLKASWDVENTWDFAKQKSKIK